MALTKRQGGRVMQIWSDRGPQGFSYRVRGKWTREFVDMEGLSLIRILDKDRPQTPWEQAPTGPSEPAEGSAND